MREPEMASIAYLCDFMLPWTGDMNASVNASWSHDCGINEIGTTGGSDDKDAGAVLCPVQFGEKLVDDAVSDARVAAAASWDERVNLVKEDDAGTRGPRLDKERAHGPFACTDIFIEDFWSPNANAAQLVASDEFLGQERFSRSGRAAQQDTNTKLSE